MALTNIRCLKDRFLWAFRNALPKGRRTNETGFGIERADNGGAFAQIAAPGPFAGTGITTYIDATVAVGNSYVYRIRAMNGLAGSAYTNQVTVSIVAAPAGAPSGLTATAAKITGNPTQDRVTLNWVDNSTNETGFTIRRATNAAFTGATQYNVAANTRTYQQKVSRSVTYYYQVRANNSAGSTAWSNVAIVTTP